RSCARPSTTARRSSSRGADAPTPAACGVRCGWPPSSPLRPGVPEPSRPPRARRRFGQHFLTDATVVARILACLDPRPGERLVEIGPGGGVLTAELLASGARVDAVEIDRDLVASLNERFAAEPRFRLHAGDALAFDFGALLGRGERCRIVGNLPYNISTPLLFRLIELRGAIRQMLFMLQKEVVDRLAAEPGTAAYGRLSVMMQAAAVVTPLFEVGPECFSPPPRVRSAVVRIEPRARGLSGAEM